MRDKAILAGLVVGSVLWLGILATAVTDSPSAPYREGQTDRIRIETWIDSLGYVQRDGANHWAEQRILARPVACEAGKGAGLSEWLGACVQANHLFASTDARRVSEPNYRAGWDDFYPGEREPGAARVASAHAPLAFGYSHDAGMPAKAMSSEANACAASPIAKRMMSEMGKLEHTGTKPATIVDIEGLSTVEFHGDYAAFRCHGVFLTDDGVRLSGTFEARTNVVGQPLSLWSPDP